MRDEWGLEETFRQRVRRWVDSYIRWRLLVGVLLLAGVMLFGIVAAVVINLGERLSPTVPTVVPDPAAALAFAAWRTSHDEICRQLRLARDPGERAARKQRAMASLAAVPLSAVRTHFEGWRGPPGHRERSIDFSWSIDGLTFTSTIEKLENKALAAQVDRYLMDRDLDACLVVWADGKLPPAPDGSDNSGWSTPDPVDPCGLYLPARLVRIAFCGGAAMPAP